MKKFLGLSFSILLLYACSETSEKPKKTPTIYGVEFCDCMIKNEMDDSKCSHIIEENKKVFGKENKEAENEFKAAAITCIRNKSRSKENQSAE